MKNCGSDGYVKSDSRSKEEIRRLESANEALTRALDSAQNSATQGNMPETEYPRLPSSTSFPMESAPQQTVAAQNAGMQRVAAASAPPHGPPAQQMQPRPPANPAFAVPGGMPDLSALDEAYRRMGQQGG